MNESLKFMMNRMDEKLRELMTKEEYTEFSRQIAKESFRIELESMADGDFKDFCLENFDTITGEVDEANRR